MPAPPTLSEEAIATPEQRERYTVAIIGCGKTGAATAGLLAEAGFRILSVSTDQRLVNGAKGRRPLFHDPKLDKLMKRHLKTQRLTITTNVKEAASASDVIIFSTPTVLDRKDEPDYSYIEKSCREVGMLLHRDCLVLCQSSVGPGITETVVKDALEQASGLKAGVDFELAYSPIRATSGRVLQEITTTPRIVGAINEHSLHSACLLLSTITTGEIIRVPDIKTAETANMFADAYSDVNHALANELAQVCEKIGIDFLEAQKAANSHPSCRLVVPHIFSIHPSKNSVLLVEEAEAAKAKSRMLALANKANDEILSHTVRTVKEALRACGKTLKRAKILILGISSHPNAKEHHRSLAKKLVQTLKRRGAFVQVYDPFFTPKELRQMRYEAQHTLTKSVEGVDCLLVAVSHTRFQRLSLRRIKFLVRKPAAIVDMVRVIDPEKAAQAGFLYRGFGRGT